MATFHVFLRRGLLGLLSHLFPRVATQDAISIVDISSSIIVALTSTSETVPPVIFPTDTTSSTIPPAIIPPETTSSIFPSAIIPPDTTSSIIPSAIIPPDTTSSASIPPEATTSETPSLASSPSDTPLPTTPETTPVESPSPTPTLIFVDNDPKYQLLGCYNELPSFATERALGATGSYISPIFASPDALTVPLCLEGCAAALAPGGKQYPYAAVENIRECYCGLTLSNESGPVEPSFCSSPCAADPTTSCGGSGFFTLYELRSAIEANTTSTTSTSSTSSSKLLAPTATSTAKPKSSNHVNMTGVWIGVGIGLAALAVIVALLLWWGKKRYNTRKRLKAMELGTETFVGGYTLEQEQPQKYVTSTGTNNGRGLGFIAASNVDSASPHEVQSAEAGRKHRDAFSAWKGKVGVPEPGQEIARNVQVETPTEVPLEESKRERRKTFEAWKSGIVPPSRTDTPVGSMEEITEDESTGRAKEFSTITNTGNDGQRREPELVSPNETEQKWERQAHPGAWTHGGDGEVSPLDDHDNSASSLDRGMQGARESSPHGIRN